MAVTGTITTRFIDEKGLDLGKQLVEKDYLISVYPNLVPQLQTPNLMVWGGNQYGQLGNNTVVWRSSPIQTVAAGANWKSIAASYIGAASSVKNDGTLWVWGYNTQGSLGTNDTSHRSSPVQTVALGTNWSAVAAGREHFLAIKSDGTLWCWGPNNKGQLGDNTNSGRSSPVQTASSTTLWKLSAGGEAHSAAIKTDGTLWMWGLNNSGQLGTNSTTTFASGISSPVQTVTFATNWMQVACGYDHTAAVKTDGSLWCWGGNAFGQLGDNTIVKKSSPVQTISGGSNWKFVACGNYITAAVKTDGTLWLWGRNDIYGSLGDNTSTNRSSPVQTISGGTNWKTCAMRDYIVSCIKTDGTLWSWGRNYYGNLADNSTTVRSSPVQTSVRGTTWKSVSVGAYNTMAIRDANY